MMTIKNLNIKDWSGYFLEEMINILDIYPIYFGINDFKQSTDGTIIYKTSYGEKIGVPHIVFNNINCYFSKNEWNSSVIFCDNIKNKNIIYICFKIIKQIRDEVFSFIDKFEDDNFIFANDFTTFRTIRGNNIVEYDDFYDDEDSLLNIKFKTDDNLLYNKKINIPLCIISISSVIEKDKNSSSCH